MHACSSPGTFQYRSRTTAIIICTGRIAGPIHYVGAHIIQMTADDEYAIVALHLFRLMLPQHFRSKVVSITPAIRL